MLHILLCILKIVGWILLVILGIIVLVICAFLFEPVRYKLFMKIGEEPKSNFVDLKFNWFFHLIRGQVLYEKEELNWQIKAAWRTFPKDNEDREDEATEEVVEKEDIRKEENVLENSLEKEKPVFQKKTVVQKPVLEEKYKERKENHEKTKKTYEKIKELRKKIKYTFQKICATIKSLQRKKEYVERFIKNETHRYAWNLCINQTKKLIRRIKPKKLSGYVEFGTADPALTGKILAIISMIYPFTGEYIEIVPDFDEKKLNADVHVSGKIRSVTFLCMAIRLIISKEVRLTYKHIKKLINRI